MYIYPHTSTLIVDCLQSLFIAMGVLECFAIYIYNSIMCVQ